VSVPPKRVGEVSVPCAASVSASGVPCCRVGSPREVHGAVVVSYTDVSGGATVSRCSPRMAMRIIRSKRSPIVCTHSRFTTSSRYAVKGRTLKGQRGFGQGGSRSGILIGSDIYAKNNSAKCQERESLATTSRRFSQPWRPHLYLLIGYLCQKVEDAARATPCRRLPPVPCLVRAQGDSSPITDIWRPVLGPWALTEKKDSLRQHVHSGSQKRFSLETPAPRRRDAFAR